METSKTAQNSYELIDDVQDYIDSMEKVNQQLEEKNQQLKRDIGKLRAENQRQCSRYENLVLELDIINKALTEQRKKFKCRLLEGRAGCDDTFDLSTNQEEK